MAWRQGVEALRNVRGIAMTAMLTIGVPVVFIAVSGSGSDAEGPSAGPMGYIMVLVMTVLMTQNLALDFRRDLDRMAYLKSLPLPAGAAALGQILPAIGVFTVLQAIAIGILALALGVALPFPAPMLLLLVPFNWLSMALDNILFLMGSTDRPAKAWLPWIEPGSALRNEATSFGISPMETERLISLPSRKSVKGTEVLGAVSATNDRRWVGFLTCTSL